MWRQIVKTNLRCWHRVTRQQKQTGIGETLVDV